MNTTQEQVGVEEIYDAETHQEQDGIVQEMLSQMFLAHSKAYEIIYKRNQD